MDDDRSWRGESKVSFADAAKNAVKLAEADRGEGRAGQLAQRVHRRPAHPRLENDRGLRVQLGNSLSEYIAILYIDD